MENTKCPCCGRGGPRRDKGAEDIRKANASIAVLNRVVSSPNYEKSLRDAAEMEKDRLWAALQFPDRLKRIFRRKET